jgi:hypothetical protein
MVKELNSNNTLIDNPECPVMFILYMQGLGFGIEIIEKNTFLKDTNEWANREIEIYEIIKKYS